MAGAGSLAELKHSARIGKTLLGQVPGGWLKKAESEQVVNKSWTSHEQVMNKS